MLVEFSIQSTANRFTLEELKSDIYNKLNWISLFRSVIILTLLILSLFLFLYLIKKYLKIICSIEYFIFY